MNNHEAIRADLGGYIVESLDDVRRAQVEHHLENCPDCSSVLEALRSIERLAAMNPPSPEPPKELADHVFALVGAEDAAQIARRAAFGPEPPPDLEKRALARAGIFPGRDKPWPVRIAAAMAPALALAAAVLSFMYADARNDLESATNPSATPSSSAVFGGVVGLPPIGHPMQKIELSGESAVGPSTIADLELVHFRHDNYRLELHAADLPELLPDHYYEVWLTGRDGEISAGSFKILWPDDLIFNFNVGIDPAEYHHIEITEEPVGGTPVREGPVVLRGNFDPAHVAHE